jgi:hypothetical protein
VHFVNILNSCLLFCCLESSSDEFVTLLGVGEVLTMENLEFPVLLDNSEDESSFVGVRDPEDGSCHTRGLRRGYTLWSET